MLRQLRESLEFIRPRSVARLHKSLDDIVEGIRTLKQAAKEQTEWNKAVVQGSPPRQNFHL